MLGVPLALIFDAIKSSVFFVPFMNVSARVKVNTVVVDAIAVVRGADR